MHKRKHKMQRPLTKVTGFGESTLTRAEALRSLGEVVYAVRIGDVVKIGHTTNFQMRFSQLHANEVLGFVQGTLDDEQTIHGQLTAHLHHGREWYYPTPGVLAVVNEMRQRVGLAPIAA